MKADEIGFGTGPVPDGVLPGQIFFTALPKTIRRQGIADAGSANAVASSWPTVLLAAPATPMVAMSTAVTTPSRDIAALAEDINPHRLGETGHEVQETYAALRAC